MPAAWMVMAFVLVGGRCSNPWSRRLLPRKLDGVAVLGRVDRLPDGLRRQVGGRAGFGMSRFGDKPATTRRDTANND